MYEDVCYGKSFLKQVIVRIDFASPLEKLEKGPPARFVNPIAKMFPIIEPIDVVMAEVDVRPEGVTHKHVTERQWNYFSRERETQLGIAPSHASIVFSKYKTYEKAKEQFKTLIDALIKSYPETVISRFGLRYINNIDSLENEPTQWESYFHDDLVAARSFFGEKDALTRLISITELKYGEFNVRFQYGMPNPDFPAPIRRPLFVIDIDASIAEAHELGRTLAHMDEAHTHVQELFERSVKNALREKMNVKQPVQD